MGQSKSKMVQPANGNLENDLAIQQRIKAQPLGKDAKPVTKKIAFNDAALFDQDAASIAKAMLTNLAEQKQQQQQQHKQPQPQQRLQIPVVPVFHKPADPKVAPLAPWHDLHSAPMAPDRDAILKKLGQGKQDDAALSKTDHESEKKKDGSGVAEEVSKYAVNYEHVKETVKNFIDTVETSDEHSANQLLKLFDHFDGKSCEWTNWNVGKQPSSVKSKLQSVTNYAESNEKCTPAVKTKLRVITKLIMEDKDNLANYEAIFLLIASHGHVCNVMKEVAINNAYHIMTGGLADYVESQTLKQQLLKVLEDLRVLLVETLFHSLKFTNNTHYIAGFHNTMANEIGVPPYNDPDICYPSSSKVPNWKKDLDKRFFKEMYTVERMVEFVHVQIETKKIGYQKVVQWFEEHCPPDMQKTEWLAKVIDMDTGKFKDDYLCFLLEKMNILLVKDDNWKPIEKTW